MQRIAIVFRLDHNGGVQSCIFSLIRELNSRGVTPDILWDAPPDPKLMEEHGAAAGFRKIHFRIPTSLIDRLPETLRYLAWILNRVDGDTYAREYDFCYIFVNSFIVSPDTPHLYYLSGPPLLPQLETSPDGLKGWPIKMFRRLYKSWLRQMSPVYDFHRQRQYVINSKYTARLFADAHGIQLPVVYPPVLIPALFEEDQAWNARTTITFFSRLVGYKRPDWMLRLATNHPELEFVVMGGVTENQASYFKSLLKDAEVRSLANIKFLPNPPSTVVREVLSRTKVYVFPAVNEHFGMTTPEAIAAGAIPFVHDSGGQREIVTNPELRFRDEEFEAKFARLIRRPSPTQRQMRDAAYEYISRFSEEAFTNKMLAYIPFEGGRS